MNTRGVFASIPREQHACVVRDKRWKLIDEIGIFITNSGEKKLQL